MRKKKTIRGRTSPSSLITSTRRFAVIGIGNPLMGDDGAGILALRLLETGLPEDTEIIDAGTGGMSLLHILSKYDAVVITDAVDMGLRPGQVRTFSPNQVTPTKTKQRLSIHEGDLLEVVKIAQQLDECPEEIRICAVQPRLICPNRGLTREVEEALPHLARAVSSELRKFDRKCNKRGR